jgi:hypothetical protein
MPATYDSIASAVLTSSTTNIDFTNIPQTYTDLIVVATMKTTTSVLGLMSRVGNGSFDSGSNYSYTALWGNGTIADSNRGSNQTAFFLDYSSGATTNNEHICIAHFMNYSNTTTNKSVVSRASRAGAGTDANINLWRSTSAINQIRFSLDFNQVRVDAGSIISLYGVRAA